MQICFDGKIAAILQNHMKKTRKGVYRSVAWFVERKRTIFFGRSF